MKIYLTYIVFEKGKKKNYKSVTASAVGDFVAAQKS